MPFFTVITYHHVHVPWHMIWWWYDGKHAYFYLFFGGLINLSFFSWTHSFYFIAIQTIVKTVWWYRNKLSFEIFFSVNRIIAFIIFFFLFFFLFLSTFTWTTKHISRIYICFGCYSHYYHFIIIAFRYLLLDKWLTVKIKEHVKTPENTKKW